MARRVGIGAHIGWAEESTYGTAVTAANHAQLAEGDETLTEELDRIEFGGMATRGLDKDDIAKGHKRVLGPWGHDVRVGGGWGLLLEHLAGNRWATAGTTNYTHTMSLGATNSALQGKGLTMVVDRDGILGSSDNAYQFEGVRPTALELSLELGQLMRAEWTLMGEAAGFVSQPSPTFPTDEFIKSPSDATSPTAAVQYGADSSETDYVVRSVKLRVAQAWEPIYDLPAAEMLEPTLGGMIEVTGEFVALYQGASTAGDAFTADYRAQTVRSLLLNFDGSTANHGLWADMANVVITDKPEVHPDTRGALWQTVPFKCLRDGATVECDLTLKNQDSAIAS